VDKRIRLIAAAGAVAALAFGSAACGGGSDNSSGTGGGGTSGKIGLLLPETKTARYESFDRPLITKRIKELCAKCEVDYQNADQDANKQLSQGEAMLNEGVKVLILDAVDTKAAGALTAKAKAKNVPVLAYDRLAEGPVDYYVSFDNYNIGVQQGKAILAGIKKGGDPKRGKVVMINGSPTDPNAADFKKGAHSVLDGQVNIGKEYDTPDWSPDKAQSEMEGAISALGKNNIIGVYAANDGTAGGAIAAMKAAGIKKLPPVTGQDAEVTGLQRVLTGEQYADIYKHYIPQAKTAGEMAIALLQHKKYPGANRKANNGTSDVPSVFVPANAITRDQIKGTIIKDGIWKASDLCTGDAATDCKQLGIS
jgi:D-xylose transport system substrate-binding protein